MLTIRGGMVKINFIFIGKLVQFRIDGLEVQGSEVQRFGVHCSWFEIYLIT